MVFFICTIPNTKLLHVDLALKRKWNSLGAANVSQDTFANFETLDEAKDYAENTFAISSSNWKKITTERYEYWAHSTHPIYAIIKE